MKPTNEEIFDKLEERFDALVEGSESHFEEIFERRAIDEHGPSASENEKQQAAIDNYDEDAETLAETARNVIWAVKRDSNYSNEALNAVRAVVTPLESHFRETVGDDLVDQWLPT